LSAKTFVRPNNSQVFRKHKKSCKCYDLSFIALVKNHILVFTKKIKIMPPLDSELSYRAVVVIGMPLKINEYIPWAIAKHDKMAANSRYTALAAKLLAFKENNSKLSDAQIGCTSKPRTVSTPTRNNLWKISQGDVRILASNVQEMADLDTENATVIITDAGFGVKHLSIPKPKKNTGYDGPEEGEVILVGNWQGPHNWRISKDQVSWDNLLAGKTRAYKSKGHTPGEVLYFQNSKVVGVDKEPVWSPIIRVVIKKH
jgi:hypothetical protein